MNKMELNAMAKDLSRDTVRGALVVGDSVVFKPLNVNGRFFSFRPDQTIFLWNLQKNEGDVEKAARVVGWTGDEVSKFFTSRKWLEYREQLLAQGAVRGGGLRDFWWEFMVSGAKGFRETYEGQCDLCHEPYQLTSQVAEMYRDDDMKIQMDCRVCKTPVKLEYKAEPFKPTREQVQCASEIGARVEPKIERVQHEYTSEEIVFLPQDVEGEAA